MLYAPYVPLAGDAVTPAHGSPGSPQTRPKSLPRSVSLTDCETVQVTAFAIQAQRSESGVGGRAEAACQALPTVGHDDATVLVGV